MGIVTILSIDGGGIRGLIPAKVLAEIEARTAKPIFELFDLVAGTSTGGLLALGLTRPKQTGSTVPAFSASALVDLYVKHGPEIFFRSTWWVVRTLWGLVGPKYTGEALEGVLRSYFEDSRLHEALTRVLLTAYDTAGTGAPAPAFFKSWRALEKEAGFEGSARNRYDFRMRELARATSSAPTYFPPFRLADLAPNGREMSLLDGGVFAANPGMCALADARLLFPSAELYVVSLGTGNAQQRISWKSSKGWGLVDWASPLIDIIFDGSSQTVEYELSELLPTLHPGARHRLQIRLPDDMDQAMDSASQETMTRLRALGRWFCSSV